MSLKSYSLSIKPMFKNNLELNYQRVSNFFIVHLAGTYAGYQLVKITVIIL